jgi:hypothetical protein
MKLWVCIPAQRLFETSVASISVREMCSRYEQGEGHVGKDEDVLMLN